MDLSRKEDRKTQVLAGIWLFTANTGYAPSYRDVAEYVGVAHSLVHGLVKELRDDGLIHATDPKVSRALRLTDAGITRAREPIERWRDEPSLD